MKLTVLGAGSWGLTLAWRLTNNFDEVCVWGRPQDVSEDLLKNVCSHVPLEIQLDQTKVQVNTNLQQAIQGAEFILLVVTTAGTREVCEQLKEIGLSPHQVLINASKGLEFPSLKRISEVIHEILPQQRVATLSGPTLAKEVLQDKPTAACVACEDLSTAQAIQNCMTVPGRFRLYTNPDIVGVELGGSLKNVIAIASGFAHTLDLGTNCTASLLTRGMAEMVRISLPLGAQPSTLYGLAGMGDLIATCSSPLSRNYTVGAMLARGKKMPDILAELGCVAEGVKTSLAVTALAKKLDTEVPIASAIQEAVETEISPEKLLEKLMSRSLKEEERFQKRDDVV